MAQAQVDAQPIRQKLHNHVQNVLRENPKIRYEELPHDGVYYHVNVHVCNAAFAGKSSFGFTYAVNNGAVLAADELMDINDEAMMRWRLGLPGRPHLDVCDTMRDCLRALRKTVKGSTINKMVAGRELGNAYQKIDGLEQALLTLGLSSN